MDGSSARADVLTADSSFLDLSFHMYDVCMYGPTCIWMHVHLNYHQESSSITPPTALQLSHLSPKFADTASLASQLALKVPFSTPEG